MERYRRVASEDASERLWVIGSVCAIVSAAVVYCLPMLAPIRVLGTFGEPDWIFLGIIHGLALLPAAVLTRMRGTELVLLLVAAFTFPVWGYILGLVCAGFLGPLLPGTAWSLILMGLFSRRLSGGFALIANTVLSVLWLIGFFVQLALPTPIRGLGVAQGKAGPLMGSRFCSQCARLFQSY